MNKRTFQKQKPTVKAVFELMAQVANVYQLRSWQDGHLLIDVTERHFRKWKRNVDTHPNDLSMISYQGYVLLTALASQTSPLEVVDVDVPDHLIKTLEAFKEGGISKEEAKQLIGLKSLSGLSVKAVAERIGQAPENLRHQINHTNDQALRFATWAMILLICGVPVSQIFPQ